MSETKFVRTQKNIGNDIWFQGKADKTASGAETYFICQYLERTHYDDVTKEFYTYCKYKKMRMDNPSEVCNMSCDQYGKCATCGGFSAVRCQECEIPRP